MLKQIEFNGTYCTWCGAIVANDSCRCKVADKKRFWVEAEFTTMVRYKENGLWNRMYDRLTQELGSYEAGSYRCLSEWSHKAVKVLDEFKEELNEKDSV